MRTISHTFLQLLILLALLSCDNSAAKADEDMIWMVGQPQVELNRSVRIRLYFAELPDKGSIKVISAPTGTEADFDGKDIEREIEIESGGSKYYYDILFEAATLGKTSLPTVEARINGKTYKSDPHPIEVVQALAVDRDAVLLVLESDKDRYAIEDTIIVTLYEYSRFSQIARFTPADLVAKGAPEALFEIIDVGNIDYKVGITDFKAYIDGNFTVAEYDWNVNNIDKQMATLDHKTYIKNRIFYMKMTAKEKGKSTMPASRFDYKIYPYEEAFEEDLRESDEVFRNKNRMTVQSRSLDIVVE